MDVDQRSDRNGRDGDLRCRRHNKAIYATEARAVAKRLEVTRDGSHDPGLEIYRCASSGGWHLGHRGGWRSLGRLYDEAGGEHDGECR